MLSPFRAEIGCYCAVSTGPILSRITVEPTALYTAHCERGDRRQYRTVVVRLTNSDTNFAIYAEHSKSVIECRLLADSVEKLLQMIRGHVFEGTSTLA